MQSPGRHWESLSGKIWSARRSPHFTSLAGGGQGHTARIGGTSTCCGAFFWLRWALIRAAASAAAAAASLLGPDPSTLFATGLRLRVAPSLSRLGGERERRSNLLRRGGSGSAWSKRERLRGSSLMVAGLFAVGVLHEGGSKSRGSGSDRLRH